MELLGLFLLLSALVWGGVYLRMTGLWGVLLATLIVGTIFGHPFFHYASLTSDRVLLGISIVLYVIYRFWNLDEPKRWIKADLLFVAYMIAMVVTTVSHPFPGTGESPINKLLFYFLLPAFMYFLARGIRLTPLQLKQMFVAFGILGLYLSMTSVAEKLELQWAIFPRYIADPDISEFLGRGRGPLLNPSGNGVLITLGLSSAMMIGMWFRGYLRTFAIGLIPLYLAGIYCTMTRCVWMGGAAALIGISTAIIPARWRLSLIVLVLGAGIAGLALKSETLVSFKRDKNVSVEDMRQSAQLRPLLAIIAWKMFQDRPWMGCGTGQYLVTAKDYLNDRNVNVSLEKARPYVQHNIFLAHLVENGLIALIPFVLLLAQWSWWSWRLWRSQEFPVESRQLGLAFLGTMAGYIANGMFQDVLIIPMINSYLFFLAGCVRNHASKLEHREIRTAERREVTPGRIQSLPLSPTS